MINTPKKTLTILTQDIICEHKNIDSQILPSSMLHQHDGNEILLLVNGKTEMLTEEGGGKVIERGDLVCIRSRSFHNAKILDDRVYDRIVINFKDSALQRLSTQQTDLSKVFHSARPRELNYIHLNETEIEEFIRLADMLEKNLKLESFGDDILADACLMQILVMVNRLALNFGPADYENVVPDMVANIFEYVEQNLTGDLSINALEQQFQYNGVYMSRCFKKVTGTSLQQYIIAKRCALAQQLLCQGVSPYDVCFLAGFHNYSNFARTFTQQTGISPKKYQLKNQ